MAFFTAIGVISNDIVRRETKNGVVTTFRLETGAPRGRKLWIDVECWGHLAGTIAHHGETERSVAVCGRLIEKVWRDRESGVRRHRVVVGASDVDLLSTHSGPNGWPPNVVATSGNLLTVPAVAETKTGTELRATLRTGRSGTGRGRLDLSIRAWTRDTFESCSYDNARSLSATGSLAWDAIERSVVLDCNRAALAFAAAQLESENVECQTPDVSLSG